MKEIIENIKNNLELRPVYENVLISREYNGEMLELSIGETLAQTYIGIYSSSDFLRKNPIVYINCARPYTEQLNGLKRFLDYALNNVSDDVPVLNEIKNLFKGESYYE